MKKEVVKKHTGSKKPITKPAIERGLTDQQVEFCKHYLTPGMFGNGVKAYALAYEINLAQPGKYNAAKVKACELLKKAEILEYLNERLEHTGLNDAFVDQQLFFCIAQNADLQAKVQAIKIYNDLKGRIERIKEQQNFQFNITIDNQGDMTQLEASPNLRSV